MTKKKIITLVVLIVAIALLIGIFAFSVNRSTKASPITVEEAEEIINIQFDEIAIGEPVKFVADKNSIKVNSISYGDEKDIVLDCTIETIDVYSNVAPQYDTFLSSSAKKPNSTMFKSTLDYQMEFEEGITKLIADKDMVSQDARLVLYETPEGLKIYTDAKALNAVFGGVNKIIEEVEKKETVLVTNYEGQEEEKKIESTNVNKGFVDCFEIRTTTDKPETAGGIVKFWNELKEDFEINFIHHGRWKTILKGLWTTIKLTFFALIIGILLGFIVAFVRCTYLKTSKHGIVLRFFNSICQIYLTVIRGTPAVVQIMIIYFVIFMPLGVDKFISAVICFGLNSGAYVAEIVRGGIMSVDDGQIEAGRSLGFNYMQTMLYIIFPQAFKAILPALANEFVVLLKETSVAFYIGLGDLMYAGNAIRSATYSAFMPLLAVALIYLVMVLGLSRLVNMLERRLRTNERQ